MLTRRALVLLVVWVVLSGSLGCLAALPVLYAQSLPATLTASWAPNPASDNVLDYQVTLDGGVPVTAPVSACTLTLCAARFDVAAYGPHSLTVAAQNCRVDVLGDLQTALASDPATFVLSAAPGKA